MYDDFTNTQLIAIAVKYKQYDKPLPVDLVIKLNELGIMEVFDEDKQED